MAPPYLNPQPPPLQIYPYQNPSPPSKTTAGHETQPNPQQQNPNPKNL